MQRYAGVLDGYAPRVLLVVTDERFLDHDSGPAHPERPGRLTAALEGMELAGASDAVVRRVPRPATEIEITAVHDRTLVRQIRSLAEAGGGRVDADTVLGPSSYDAASLAAGAVLTAVEELTAHDSATEGLDFAYCIVRPPGHHATPDRSMGFCLFNSVAIAARSLTSVGQRVAIVDFDAHHGNGTQEAFLEDPSVFYASIHQSPLYPGTGTAFEVGVGAGVGFTLNVPLPPGATGDVALMAMDDVIGPAVEAFSPDWLLISAGFDGHRDDPLTQLMYSSGDIADLMARLVRLVRPGRVVTVLEGGYDLAAVRNSSAAVVGCLVGEHCRPEASTSGGPGAEIVDVVRRIHVEASERNA